MVSYIAGTKRFRTLEGVLNMKVAIVIWKDPKRWVFSCSEVDELGCSSQKVHCARLVCVYVCVCVHICAWEWLCVWVTMCMCDCVSMHASLSKWLHTYVVNDWMSMYVCVKFLEEGNNGSSEVLTVVRTELRWKVYHMGRSSNRKLQCAFLVKGDNEDCIELETLKVCANSMSSCLMLLFLHF